MTHSLDDADLKTAEAGSTLKDMVSIRADFLFYTLKLHESRKEEIVSAKRHGACRTGRG